MHIQFLGAAGEVTGSCYLVETDDCRFLIDCGLFQGGWQAAEKNRDALRFDLRSLDFVIVTHAHIDHSGLLPRLVALGFRGPIYTTPATADLLQIMLLDCAHIQESEASYHTIERRRRHPRSRRDQAPLYSVTQAQQSLRQIVRSDYEMAVHPHRAVHFRFRDAGHILGSAITEIWVTERTHTRKIVCSGDLGQPGRPILCDPVPIHDADVLLVESTYGNRQHKSLSSTMEELSTVLNETLIRRHGNVIIPAFAVGRAQEILYLLAQLAKGGQAPPRLRIYVDSPMAANVTNVTLQYTRLFDSETLKLLTWAEQPQSHFQVRFVHEVRDSVALNRIHSGAVILSASGMCDAGRILHHLLHNLGRRECSIVITGFQAEGTLGRHLVDGAKHVQIMRKSVPVKARIHTLGGLSAHADQNALLGWLRQFEKAPENTFIVHGETQAATELKEKIEEQLHWTNVTIPQRGESARWL